MARVTKVIDVNTREKLINTTRYFTTIINQFAITRITERVIMLFVTVIIIISRVESPSGSFFRWMG